ncbi:hypothetical protein E5288_WYG016171 [Bos mutus]|uniref:Uncharacterized protein n=1 Tax=Bos mutus TaxID=72004 RepID=A0A6B0RK71_9CETA|nr:hypothetical protein [Bos mutus]
MGSEPWLSLAQGLSHVGIAACVSDGGLDVTYLCGSDIWPVVYGTVQLLYSPSPNSGQLLQDIFLRFQDELRLCSVLSGATTCNPGVGSF